VRQTHAAAPVIAALTIPDHFNALCLERAYDFHERLRYTPYVAFAGLHALNGRERNAGTLSQSSLVHSEQGPRCSHLRSGNHLQILRTCESLEKLNRVNPPGGGKATALNAPNCHPGLPAPGVIAKKH
jgi:hypothetical protein